MPNRVYRPRPGTPRWKAHLYAHSYEVIFAVVGILSGALVLLRELLPDVLQVSPALAQTHGIVPWLVGISVIAGNALILLGLFDDGDDLMDGWRRERSGLVIAAAAFAGYALVVVALFPASVLSWLFPLGMATAHVVRLRSTYDDEDTTRDSVARHENGGTA